MASTTASIATKEPEQEEDVSKYMLLNRLFAFLKKGQKPLNPVLAGYFSKLLTILV